MKVIGLCGGSGSGKGTVGRMLFELGIPTIDTDSVYRELTSKPSECLRALSLEFGDRIISPDGGLDRKALRDLVFYGESSEARLKKLNEISHAYILCETRRWISVFEKDGYGAVTVDAPLLFESGFDRECDAIIAVLADTEVRVDRIMKRDGIDREAAGRRISTQIPDEELRRRADFIIVNSGNTDTLLKNVSEVAEKILKL